MKTLQKYKIRTLAVQAMLAVCMTAASAQDVAQSDLELCAGMETAELKLACFEALTAIGSRGEPVAEQVDSTVVTPEPVADESPPAKPDVQQKMDASPVAQDPIPAVAAQPQRAVPAVEPERHANLGSEQLERTREKSAEDDQIVILTVSKVTEGRYDILYFHMENGQVWRQMEARRFRYPKNEPFDVRISQGMMGDYRLRLGENDPMTRIRRVK